MKTVIEMAREVYGQNTEWSESQLERLKQLEALIRADERDACAEVSEEYDDEYDVHTEQTKQGITDAIRARSNT